MISRARRFLLKATGSALGLVVLGSLLSPQPAAAWEPTKTVEFIVPAGTGGGADQMARMIQGIIQKYNLMDESIVVINKSGGAGAEGFLYVKAAQGDPHKIIITLSNLFTTPLATGTPFSWKDMTPVAMLALDNFIWWVNSKEPYKTPQEYIEAAKKAGPGKFKQGGTGAKQEDQLVLVATEEATGAKWTYIPYEGGGKVAAQLVGGHINSSVNNPIEGVSHWRAGNLRPLCVFAEERIDLTEKITADMSWHDIPTCKETGLDVAYQMLRGIFTSPGVSQDQVDYYIDLFKKVRETPEWKDFMQKGAFDSRMMTGDKFNAWLTDAAALHEKLMTAAGFVAK